MKYSMDNNKIVKCIICGRLKERSLEHIIPKALGNEALKIYDICRDCNSKLGDNVDVYLTNNFFIEMIRQKLRIPGQSGKTPNPFKDGVDENGNLVRVDQDFKPHIVPKSTLDGNKLHIVGESKEQVIEMGLKKLKRIKATDSKIQEFLNATNNAPVHESAPKLSYEVEIDIQKLYLAVLKIAYEYAYLKLGKSYYEDPTAEKIRSILYEAVNGKFDKQYEKISFAPQFITDRIKLLSNIQGHLIIMSPDKGKQLVVNVILFMSEAFSFSVCVSDNAILYQELFTRNPMIADIIDIYKNNN